MYDELTQVDIDKMKAELEHRRLELRPKLIEDVQTARAFGDLSENYEYKVAKQEKNRNESRIRYLERMIATAKVIEVEEKAGTVGLFDHVVLFNEKLGKEQNIQLVTTLRQNALKGLISKESPVGKADLFPQDGLADGRGRFLARDQFLLRKFMKQVIIYTDGACSGNPGPGGWGAVLKYGAHERELSGGEASTTNNRMELTAVIEALRLLKEPCVVELYSDSRYVIDALEKRWVYGWKQRGWVKSDKKPALNVDLWEQLLSLIARHEMHYHWVKGHAENEYNNRCDEMAVAESHKFK